MVAGVWLQLIQNDIDAIEIPCVGLYRFAVLHRSLAVLRLVTDLYLRGSQGLYPDRRRAIGRIAQHRPGMETSSQSRKIHGP
ncbi:hypothetical protein ACQAYK_02860 [Acidithiobacillus sp. AC3]